MNIWIKRSLGTIAVTGGLVLAGAAAAQADDLGPVSTSNESSSSSEGSASAPITIGGVDVGTSSESSSSSSSETTVTDGDRSSTEKVESEDSSSNGTRLMTEGISLDPGAAISRSSEADSSSTSGGTTGSQESSSSSESSGSASAPVRIGGIEVTNDRAAESSRSSERSATDGDRSTSEKRESESSSSSSTSLGTEAITLDPQAAFERSDARESSRLGRDLADDSSESGTSGSASAPVSIGGLVVTDDRENAGSEKTERTATDGDRSTSEVRERSNSSSDSTSFGTGALTLEPGTSLEHGDARESSRVGRDLADSSSESSSSGAASLPIGFEGFVVERDTASESQDAARSEVVDGDRSSVRENASIREDESSTSFGGGGFELNPNVAFDDEQARESSRLGRDSSDSSSRSQTSTTGGLPISFDGLTGSNESSQLRADRGASTVTDGDRSVSETVQTGSLVERGFDATGGAFTAEPAFGVGTERTGSNDRLGGLSTTSSSNEADGFVAGPFDGGAFDVTGWSNAITENLRESRVVDGDRSTTTVTEDRSERDDAQDFGFDGIEGNPAGSFDTRADRISDLIRR